MIWILAAIMAVATGVAMLWPLGSKTPAQGRAETAMAIYEDQLSELDRDADRGLITAEEARAAQIEIKRRMLAVGSNEAQGTERGRTGILIAALFVPLAGFGLYSQVGAPDIPAMPFAERGAEQDDARQLQQLVVELRTRLEADPDGGETRGWELLAQTYMNMNRPSDAARAFEQIADREDATSATLSQYAEALITAESGVVTPRAGRIIDRALALDASNPAATYYRSLEMDQAGDAAGARTLLLDRLGRETQLQPWMPTFLTAANGLAERLGLPEAGMPEFEAPRGPSAADIAAAGEMSEGERTEFIRSMVDGLEARLQDEPGDLDGWLQLARALVVLGEEDRAFKALQAAEPLVQDLPEDDQRRRLVEVGLERFGDGQ